MGSAAGTTAPTTSTAANTLNVDLVSTFATNVSAGLPVLSSPANYNSSETSEKSSGCFECAPPTLFPELISNPFFSRPLLLIPIRGRKGSGGKDLGHT